MKDTNLTAKLAQLREYVKGCEFAHAAEVFKDLEGVKVQMRAAGMTIPPAIAKG
jgi:hypothetical protein